MKTIIRRTVMIVGFLAAGAAILNAGSDHDHMKPNAGSKEFERMKQLVGRWTGTVSERGGKENKATADYSLTSNGSVVVEKLFVGTPHEMVSTYYDRKGKLTMTHYCALGNRPNLVLKKAGPDTLELKLSATNSGLDSRSEDHMHALTLVFPGPNKLTQEWSGYEKGKETGPTVVKLIRRVAP